ncbi:MAG: hypothetical protein ABI581_08070 [Sediminibacterium sp.]
MKTSHNFLSLLFVSVLLFSFTKPVYQANFSGTWNLNTGKSDLGQFGGRGVATKIVVDQKADGVTTTKTTPGFNGGDPTDVTETLTNDGKETETTMFGTAKRKSTLKWAADGNTFGVAYSVAFGQGEFKGNENWVLNADGKEMTITTLISSPQGEITLKAVYDKQ